MTAPAEPLTVVHFSTQHSWHGGEGQAYHLICGLRQRGHRVVVMARAGGQFARRTGDAGFEVHQFRRRGRGPDSLWKVRSRLKKLAPHVIHSHDGHALTCSGLASLGLAIPLRVASRRVDFPIHSAAKYNRLADVVIAISSAVAAACRDAGIPDARIRVVHSGVDPARALSGDRARGRLALGVGAAERLILVVAKLTDHKGHRYLLDAMPDVLRRFPHVRLALAGGGELADQLAGQARRLRVDHRVMFLDYRDDIPDLLQATDLFVMPSHMEGLCTSLLDAIFARVPVVTTGAGGIADVIGADLPEGPVTFTAPARDAGALAAAIIDALSSPEKAALLADRAELRARAMFTRDCMVEGTLAVYREMLARRQVRAA